MSQIPINGIPADLYRALSLRSGKDLLTTEKEIRDFQTNAAQRVVKPQIDTLDTVINSADPVTPLTKNQQIRQAWAYGAPLAGLDPNDLSDPAKVRVGLTMGRNTLAAQAQLPPVNAPVQVRQIKGPLGQMLSESPVTGEIKQEVAPQETAQFITPQGVRMMTKAEGIAKGYEPYNPATLVAAQMKGPGGDLIAALGQKSVSMPTGTARSPQMQVAMADKIMSRNPGMSADQVAEMMRTGQLDFNGAKRSTAQIATLATATDIQSRQIEKNFNSLAPLVQKNGIPKLNGWINSLQQNLTPGGDKEATEAQGYLLAIAGEYAKLRSGSTGAAAPAEGEMKIGLDYIRNALTQGGFDGARSAIITEAQNKRDSVREGLRAAATPGFATGTQAPTVTAPASTPTAKAMPAGPKLQAYAAAHFGGDTTKAQAFLKSQGYQ